MLSRLHAQSAKLTAALARFNGDLTSLRNPALYALNPSSDVTQFSKAKLVNFGELEDGEIPEALKYSRPCKIQTLTNGLRVATEATQSPLAHVALMVQAGTRNENMSNSGIGHFLSHLKHQGTDSLSGAQIVASLADVGGQVWIEPGHDTTTYHLEVLKEGLPKAFEVFADIVKSNKFSTSVIESERERALAELVDMSKANFPKTLITENVHYTAFRDHMIGQPLRGNQKSLRLISSEDIQKYVDTHYVGSRMVLVGTGNVAHQTILDLAERHLGQLAKTAGEITGEDTPLLTGSQVAIRDDDVELAHCGVFFQAPSFAHEDYFAFMMLKRLMGDYNPKRDGIINHPRLQYNWLHTWLGEIEDIIEHQSMYWAYKDVALFGHYVSCLDLGAHMAPMAVMKASRRATSYIMDSELYRSRNKLYNDLLALQSPGCVASEAAKQLLYANRRIPRSEIAKRVSLMDNRYLEKIYAKWMWDTELALAFYGPIFMPGRDYNVYRSYTNDQILQV
jgi:processing peptidase subunit beta